MNKLVLLLCGTGLQFTMLSSLAQESETISAERPGFSSSPLALPASVLQVESGYQYTRDSGGLDIDDHTIPLLLVRVGLAERLEMQLSWAGMSWTEVGSSSVNGINDAGIGIKWQLSEPGAAVPIAVFAGLSLPVGETGYTSDEFDPTLGAFWSYSSSLDWFGTLLISESGSDVSIDNAVGISLPVNNETSAYVEYFGNYGSNGGPSHYLNGGFAYVPRNDIQLDAHLGVGLNDQAADLFLGLGIAYRF